MQTEQLPRLEAGEYPGGIWYYEPHTPRLGLALIHIFGLSPSSLSSSV